MHVTHRTRLLEVSYLHFQFLIYIRHVFRLYIGNVIINSCRKLYQFLFCRNRNVSWRYIMKRRPLLSFRNHLRNAKQIACNNSTFLFLYKIISDRDDLFECFTNLYFLVIFYIFGQQGYMKYITRHPRLILFVNVLLCFLYTCANYFKKLKIE